jgi:hypothetical protein
VSPEGKEPVEQNYVVLVWYDEPTATEPETEEEFPRHLSVSGLSFAEPGWALRGTARPGLYIGKQFITGAYFGAARPSAKQVVELAGEFRTRFLHAAEEILQKNPSRYIFFSHPGKTEDPAVADSREAGIYLLDQPQDTTKPNRPLPDLREYVQNLFDNAVGEDFGSEFESQFSKNLKGLVKYFEKDAIETISVLIFEKRLDPFVVAEALRVLGNIKHSVTRAHRIRLEEDCLASEFAVIRSGAISGMFMLDNAGSAVRVRELIPEENSPLLKMSLEKLLQQLERKH